MTTTEATAPTAPIYPVIYATSVQYADVRLSAADRAALVARADRFRELTETTDRVEMQVPIVDAYNRTTVLGHATFKV